MVLPGSSLRARLALLVLVATVPLLLFSVFLVERAFRVSTSLIEDAARGYALRVATTVDAQVERAEAVAMAVSELPALDQPELTAFEDAATRALAAAGLDGVLLVAKRDGSVIANTLGEPGRTRAPVRDRDLVEQVFATGLPQVSGVYVGRFTHQPQVALHVPVVRDDEVHYDAVVALPARTIAAGLATLSLPDGWFAFVADRGMHVIARTPRGGEDAGEPLSPGLAALAASRPEGFGTALSVEGKPILAGFTRSHTGWLIGVAVPQSIVRGPSLRSLGALLGGGAFLLLLSLALAWRIGQGIARPIDALAREASRLGRNEVPDPTAARGFAEAETAADALHEAGRLLISRDQERAATLARAEASEARLLLAQEVGQIGAWETDAVTGRRTWSQQQFRLYGLDPVGEPPHGPAWAKLIHPEDRARVAATVNRAYGAPMSYQHEFRIIRPGGTVRWLRTAGRSEFRNGRLVRLVGIAFDSTERHESERALREGAARLEAEVAARTRELAESEARFRTYFEHSGDAMLVVRVEGEGRFVFETINEAGERLTGLERQDLVGRTLEEVLLPATAEAMAAAYREVAAGAAPVRIERSLTLPAGMLELETVVVPVWDAAGGRVTRILSGHRDLTERRRIEARLAHAQRLEAVGQLTGGVAHDFNNLLTVVIGNLALLRRRIGTDERAQHYLASVEAAADRGAKLTASLLAFSRRQTLRVEPVDVGARLHESATLLRRALGEEIAFTLEIAAGLPHARADTAQLEAAVLNLSLNARDAIREALDQLGRRDGALRIEAREAVLLPSDLEGNDEARPGRFVAIEVKDNGIGMRPEVRPRAFEPFFTTKEVGKGTGLGLSQVFGFVRQLGGHVTLDSTPGHGTRIVMYLPVATAEGRAPEAPASPVMVPTGATVLVVEDDASIRDVTAEVLRDAGLSVITASDGPSALAVLAGNARVDLLFSDVVMPGGATGVELARAAHALRPSLCVLLTSGYGGPALSRYGAEGEYEVLAKPYTRTVLLARIGHMLSAAASKLDVTAKDVVPGSDI